MPPLVKLNLKPDIVVLGEEERTACPLRLIIVVVRPLPLRCIVLFSGMVTVLFHVQVPAGTWIVSPLDAADIHAVTSAFEQFAAVQTGLDPEQAAPA
jgi:hypothetical protein